MQRRIDRTSRGSRIDARDKLKVCRVVQSILVRLLKGKLMNDAFRRSLLNKKQKDENFFVRVRIL